FESYEPSFHQDLNGDGSIGPVVTTIESFGSTRLVQSANHFLLFDSNGNGPSLKYGGSDFVVTPGSWTPIGAEPIAGGYEVAWHVPGTDQWSIWTTDSNGNFSGNPVGVVTATSPTFESYEPSFHQDLNGDGTIGSTAMAIEGFGVTHLAQGADHVLFSSNDVGPS